MPPKRTTTRVRKKAERLAELDRINRDIEAKILMTDDDEQLLLMGSLFLATARNIFIAIHGIKKTKAIITQFCRDIK